MGLHKMADFFRAISFVKVKGSIEFCGFFFDFDSILGGRDVPAWSLHSPYKSLETLIFRMLDRIAAQESYQGRF